MKKTTKASAPKASNFAVFILTYGRPDRIHTLKTLKRCGYSGDVYFICSDDDSRLQEYQEQFGDRVIVFNKIEVAKTFDMFDNFKSFETVTYARNFCYDAAERLGLDYFVQLDDDYTSFSYARYEFHYFRKLAIKNIDVVFAAMFTFLHETKSVETVCFLQGGDFIGGFGNGSLQNGAYPWHKRKAMNSFFCATDRRITFVGKMNDDVNTYVSRGKVGKVMLSVPWLCLKQLATQSNDKGLTDLYLQFGTYVKSMYTCICAPSSTKIAMMGTSNLRLHHHISWRYAVPVILEEKHRKNSA
jgi:hypothetical protein